MLTSVIGKIYLNYILNLLDMQCMLDVDKAVIILKQSIEDCRFGKIGKHTLIMCIHKLNTIISVIQLKACMARITRPCH